MTPRSRYHPAGRSLVSAQVTWVGSTALVELVNKRGRIMEFVITGPMLGRRRARVAGRDRLAVVYDIAAGSRLTILLDDESQRILYDGFAPSED